VAAADTLRKIGDQQASRPGPAAWEAANVHTLASVLVASAALRTETRGSHWREDYPESSDDWIGHLIVTLGRSPTGRDSEDDEGLAIRFVPTPKEPGS
jgi:L-aspartate oxidase